MLQASPSIPRPRLFRKDAAGPQSFVHSVPRGTFRRLVCYSDGMSTNLTSQSSNFIQRADLGDLTQTIQRAGFDAELENTGGGCMVIIVKAGAREVTIADNGERGHDVVTRPYHGHFWNDEGDSNLDYEYLPAVEVVDFLHKVAAENPGTYWVWRSPDGREVSVRYGSAQDANEFAVTGCELVKVTASDVSLQGRIDDATTKAEDAFWGAIAAAFPEAKFGDYDGFTLADMPDVRTAIGRWVELNVPGAAA